MFVSSSLKRPVARRYYGRQCREWLKPKTTIQRGNSRRFNQCNFVLGLESVPLLPLLLADVSVRAGVRPQIDLGEACG